MVLKYTNAWSEANDYCKNWLIDGIHIPFKEIPESFNFENNRQFNRDEYHFLQCEINDLLSKGLIEACDSKPYGVSPISCVPKKGNKFRLVHDLRHLNTFSEPEKFQYEDISNVISQLQPEDVMITCDIKSGFYHVPVNINDCKYLGFKWSGKYYQWTVTPFGLNCSPFYFCKLLRYGVQRLREKGLRISVFVDDILLMSTENEVENHKQLLLEELESLGFIINLEKSVLVPSKIQTFIGYKIHSEGKPYISIPSDRVYKLRKDIKRLLSKGCASARIIARVAGQCIAMTRAIIPGKLLLRNLYRLLATKNSWDEILHLDKFTINDLNWWLVGLQEINVV